MSHFQTKPTHSWPTVGTLQMMVFSDIFGSLKPAIQVGHPRPGGSTDPLGRSPHPKGFFKRHSFGSFWPSRPSPGGAMMGLPGPIFNPRNTSSVTSIWCFLVKYWCGNILMEIFEGFCLHLFTISVEEWLWTKQGIWWRYVWLTGLPEPLSRPESWLVRSDQLMISFNQATKWHNHWCLPETCDGSSKYLLDLWEATYFGGLSLDCDVKWYASWGGVLPSAINWHSCTHVLHQ